MNRAMMIGMNRNHRTADKYEGQTDVSPLDCREINQPRTRDQTGRDALSLSRSRCIGEVFVKIEER